MKRRILLVDDEVAVLLTLKAVLEISGFDVDTAASGREGKSKLRTHEYHMVITDMRMESDEAGTRGHRGSPLGQLPPGHRDADRIPCRRRRLADDGRGQDAGQADAHPDPAGADRETAGGPRGEAEHLEHARA